MARQVKYNHNVVVTGGNDGTKQVSQNAWNDGHNELGMFGWGSVTTLTVATGAITPVNSYHKIDGEGASDDDLATITNTETSEFDELWLVSGAQTITLVNSGNIVTLSGQNKILSATRPTKLIRVGTSWYEVSGDAVLQKNQFVGRQEWAKGADIASADAITFGVGGNVFDITGTTTINHFNNTGIQDGTIVTLQFDGALTLTHNAGSLTGDEENILLSGDVNYNTSAGDILTFILLPTGWEEIARNQASGVTADSTTTFTNKTINDFTNTVHADTIHLQIRNESGGAITKGQAVYISGYSVGSDLPLVSLADADSSTTMPAIGLVSTASIANNANGEVIVSGRLSGFDTSSFTAGDSAYISSTAGALSTRPTGATQQVQKLGTILRSHATLGVIDIRGAGRTNDVPNSFDINGRVELKKGSDIASADAITFGTDGNLFDITGVTTINHFNNTNMQDGTMIVLHFDGALTLTHNAGSLAGDEENILLAGDTNYSTTAGDILTFILHENGWEEISRNSATGGSSLPVVDTTALVKGSADATKLLRFEVDGQTTGITGVFATTFTTAKTLTFPDVTDTMVARTTTDTLTNKSISFTNNTLTGTKTEFDTALSDDNFAFLATSQTFTAKQIMTSTTSGDAGLNVGSSSGAPTTNLANGDVYYNTTDNKLYGRINTAWVDLGQSGAEVFNWTANHNASTFALVDPLFADNTDTSKRLDINLTGITTSITGSLAFTFTTAKTLTFPDVTDTMVARTTTDTLTNKTMDANNNTFSNFEIGSEVSGSTIAGTTLYVRGTGATGFIDLDEITTPANPSANVGRLYVKDDATVTKLYFRDSAGTETDLLAGGGSTPPFTDTTALVKGSADATKLLRFEVDGQTTGITGVLATTFTTAKTLTFPDATDTLVGKATTDTFTNKSYDLGGTGNVLTGTKAQFDTAVSDGTFMFENDTNVVTGAIQITGGTMRIPLSATPTMAVDGDFAIDTTVTDFSHGIMKYFDGEEMAVVALPIAQLTTPTGGHVIAYNATNDEFELVAGGGGEVFTWTADHDASDFDLLQIDNITSGANNVHNWDIAREATLADGTEIGSLRFRAFDGGGALDTYASIKGTLINDVNTSEEGRLELQVLDDGALRTWMTFDAELNEINMTIGLTSMINITNTAVELTAGKFISFDTGANAQFIRGDSTGIQFEIPTGDIFDFEVNNVNIVEIGESQTKIFNSLSTSKGSDIASATEINLGSDGNVFDITGTTTIEGINSTNWQAGSVVTLQFDGALTLTHGAGTSPDLILAGATNATVSTGEVFQFFYNGTDWVEISRNAGDSGSGSQTPWTSDIDADGFDLTDLSNIEFRSTTGAPAGTVQAIWADAGGINLNVPTADTFDISVNGTIEYSFAPNTLSMVTNAQHNFIMQRSADLSAGTIIGEVSWRADVAPQDYVTIQGIMEDTAGGAEDGSLKFVIRRAGGLSTMYELNDAGNQRHEFSIGTGDLIVGISANGLGIESDKNFYLDGADGAGDTYIHQGSPNFMELFSAGTLGLTIFATGGVSDVVCGQLSALATTATDGFLYLPSMAGVPTGNSRDFTGKFPIVWDSTNTKLMLNTTGTTWIEVGGEVFTWTANHSAGGFDLTTAGNVLLNADETHLLDFTRDTAQADDYTIAEIRFRHDDGLAVLQNYARITGVMESDVDASEDGSLHVFVTEGGSHDVEYMAFNDASTATIDILKELDMNNQKISNMNGSTVNDLTTVTPVATDMVLIWDATDSALKKVDASNFLTGGSQTPWISDIDADGFDLTDLSNIVFRTTTGAPTLTTDRTIYYDDAIGMRFNSLTGDIFEWLINGTSEMTLNATTVDFQGNTLTDIADITSITNLNGVAIGNYLLTTDQPFSINGTDVSGTVGTNLVLGDFDISAKPTPNTDFFEILVETTVTDDSGTEPLFHINLRRDTPASVVTRNLLEISNNDVAQLTMLNNGDVDFEGNSLTDIADITSITNLNGVAIGNYATNSNSITFTNKTIDADGTGNVITNIGSSEIKSEMITGFATVTGASGDFVLISDTSDSGNLKKVDVVDFLGGTALPVSDSTSVVEGSVDPTKELRFEVDGNTTGIVGVIATSFTTAKTITIPDATDTLVGKATTDVFTNKSIDANGTGNVITNIGDAEIETHTTTKISTTNKSLLNSAIVYNDQTNTFGDFAQVFLDNQFFIQNPAGTFEYQFIASAIGADRTVTLPLLTGNDTFVFEAFAQTLTNKTVNLTSNTLSGTKSQFDTALNDDNFAYLATAQTFTAKQTMTSTTSGDAGLNVGSSSGAPTTNLANGDIYYNTTDNKLYGRINTAWVDLGQSGGEVFTWTANHDMATFNLISTGSQTTDRINLPNDNAIGFENFAGTANLTLKVETDDWFGFSNDLRVHTTSLLPQIQTYKQAIVADGTDIGNFEFQGIDDGSNAHVYARIVGRVESDVSGSEDGSMRIDISESTGVLTTYANFNAGNSGRIDFQKNVTVPSTNRIYVDGGTDSYLYEAAADDVRFAVGGQFAFKMVEVGGEVDNVFGKASALATTATNGFVYLPSTAGTPTGAPTAYTGKTALVYDSTNNILYANDGGGWSNVGAGGSEVATWTQNHSMDTFNLISTGSQTTDRINLPNNAAIGFENVAGTANFTIKLNSSNIFEVNADLGLYQTGSIPDLFTQRSDVVADGTVIGRTGFAGFSDTSVVRTYAQYEASVESDVNLSEEGSFEMKVLEVGSLTTYIHLNDAGANEINLYRPTNIVTTTTGANFGLDRQQIVADNSRISNITFKGLDDASNTHTYARIDAILRSDITTAEESSLVFSVTEGGADDVVYMTFNGTGATKRVDLFRPLTVPATNRIYFDGGNDTSIRESAADTITFETAGTDRATIQSGIMTFINDTHVKIIDTNSQSLFTGSRQQAGLASGQAVAQFLGSGYNSTPSEVTYGIYTVSVRSNTAGAEYGDFVIQTMLNGSVVTALSSISNTGRIVVGSNYDFIIPATKKIFLDGGSNTSIRESSADTITFEIGGTDEGTFTGSVFNLGAGAKFQEGGVNISPIGTQQFWIPASAMKPTVTSGALGLTTREMGANNQNVEAMEFADGADSSAYVNWVFPQNWNLGTIKFRYYWFRENDEATPETKTTEFELKGVSLSNFNALGGTAMGTAVGVVDSTDSTTAENKLYVSAQSGVVTIAGSPSDTDYISIEVKRKDVPASGTAITGSVYLLGIMIEYTIDAGTSTG